MKPYPPSTSECDSFRGVIKLNIPLTWALIQSDWCPYMKRKFGHTHVSTQRKDHVRKQREGGCPHTKERGLGRDQPCDTSI